MSFDSVTPLLPAGPSLDDALRLWVGHLGFHVTWQGPNMAGIERDGVAFNLIQNDNREAPIRRAASSMSGVIAPSAGNTSMRPSGIWK